MSHRIPPHSNIKCPSPGALRDSFGLHPFCRVLLDRWREVKERSAAPGPRDLAWIAPEEASATCAMGLRDLSMLHPLCRALLIRWEEGRGSAFAPSWRALDLIRIDPPAALLRCTMVEIADDPDGSDPAMSDPSRFVLRFFGTWHVRIHGCNLTGQAVDKIGFAGYRERLLAEYRQTVAARAPRVFGCAPLVSLGVPCGCQTIQLPLSEDGNQVSAIVSATAIPEGEPYATSLFRDERWRK